jgi:hypothetical protein
MASLDLQAIRFLVGFYQELNTSIDKLRKLLETGKLKCDHLRRQAEDMIVQEEKLAAEGNTKHHIIQGNEELIQALVHNLEYLSTRSIMACSDLAPIMTPPRPHTPWPAELILSQTSSESTFNASLDSQCLIEGAVEEQSQKRGNEIELKKGFKKQRHN